MTSDSDTPSVLTVEELITFLALLDRLDRDGLSDERVELDHVLSGLEPLPLPRPISDVEVASFVESGWVLLPGFYGQWHEAMRAAALEIIDEPGWARHERSWPGFAGRSVRHDQSRHLSHVLRGSAMFGVAPRIARALLGDDGELFLRGAAVFVKEPPIAYGSPWHVDLVERPGAVDRGVHVWVALDDGEARHGAVQLVAGSHRWTDGERSRRLDPTTVKAVDEGRLPAPDHASVPGLRGPVDSTVAPSFRAGDVLAFDSRMVHGAAGNRTDRTFVAAASMWLAGELELDGAPA